MKNRSAAFLGLVSVASWCVIGCAVSSSEVPPAAGTGNVTTAGGVGGTAAGAGGTPGVGGTAGSAAGVPGAGGSAGTVAGSGGTAGSAAGVPGAGGSAGTVAGSGGTAGTTAGASAGGAAGSVAAGAGGVAGSAAGSSGTGAGSAGAAGTSTTGMGCSDGCAELSVPFTAINTSQDFDIYIAASDLTGRAITFRVRTISTGAGGFQVFAKNGEALDYAYVKSGWNDFSTTSAWTDVTLDLATVTPDASNVAFDPTQITILTLQMHSGGTDLPANPTIAQVDSVTLTPAASVGPWPFTTDAAAVKLSTYMPIAGATVTFVGP